MREHKYQGLGISPGIAIGEAFVVELAKPVVWMHRIDDDHLEDEIRRFEKALAETKESIESIKRQIGQELGDEHAYIFDAHLLMLQDPFLVDGTKDYITNNRVNTEFALQQVSAKLSETFKNFEDDYLRERGVDVLDVANRVQWYLNKPYAHSEDEAPELPSILVSHDVHPSKLASMETANVLGLAMDVGGQTTHTGLLATAKGIPAVVGLRDLSVIVKPGEKIIIDGTSGDVIISPTQATIDEYLQKQDLYHQHEEELLGMRDFDSVTTDGERITLNANIELLDELDPAFNKHGAAGVGLYRSEFVYLANPNSIPSEEDHYQLYSNMAKTAGGRPLNVRTIDLGGEKQISSLDIGDETNPALGLRAVRFGLKRKAIFKAQLRGILRASLDGDVRILIPMISGLGEFLEVKKLIEECKSELLKENHPFKEDIQIGLMIEVPSAAIIADVLAAEADFISVGTNDLIQYLLAIDRGNEYVSYLYEPLHPAVLRTLWDISQKCTNAGTNFAMCGEMAADPTTLPLLIGMGFRDLSMNPLSIPVIKSVIRHLDAEMCREMAIEALKLPSVRDVYAFLRQRLETVYPEIRNLELGLPIGDRHES
jgi:phosphotransferase system enzyme I (PtsI)